MRNYRTLSNIRLARGNNRGVVRVRKYSDGTYTLYTKMYNIVTGKLINRSLNKFTSWSDVNGWAQKFVKSAVDSGAQIVSH